MNVAGPVTYFTVTPGNCSGQMVPAKKSCTFTVTFAPQTVNMAVDQMLPIPYDGASPLEITLTGNAEAATLVAPKTESFAATTVGKTSPPKTVTIMNTTVVPITLQTGTITPGNNFVIVGGGADKC